MSLSMRDTVYKSVSASNRNTAILSVIAIAIAVGAFALGGTSKFIFGYFGSSTVLTEEILTSATAETLPIHKSQVTGLEMFDSNMYEETTTTRNGVQTGTSTTAYFGFLTVGEYLIMVKTPGVIRENLLDYEGVLTEVGKDEVGIQVYNEYMTEYPNLEGVLLPLLLDTGYDNMPWFLGAGAEAVLLLGGLFGLATVAGRRNPENHPIIKRMARFGDTESVMGQIDNEMSMGEPAKVDKLQFTRSWTIYKAGNDLHFMRTADVVWAYKHVTQTRYGKNYAAYIWDRTGHMLNIGGSEKNVDEMIIGVLQRAPWAIAGYNRDVEKSWKNDREGFVRTVEDRRRQMTTPQ